MINRILVKKINKGKFGKKDSFTITDIAPKEYYKLPTIDKLYFTKNIMGFNKVLENIKPHDITKCILPDGTVYEKMLGNEFVISLSNIIKIWEKLFFTINFNDSYINDLANYGNILLKIIKNAEKIGKKSKIIFVMEKNNFTYK